MSLENPTVRSAGLAVGFVGSEEISVILMDLISLPSSITKAGIKPVPTGTVVTGPFSFPLPSIQVKVT